MVQIVALSWTAPYYSSIDTNKFKAANEHEKPPLGRQSSQFPPWSIDSINDLWVERDQILWLVKDKLNGVKTPKKPMAE